jgi:hypothetical protein
MASADTSGTGIPFRRATHRVWKEVGAMKHLSFFKVYGRTDPRLAERRQFTEWSDSPPEYRCEMIGPIPHFVHQSQTVTQEFDLEDFMRNNYRIMRARREAYAAEPEYLMGRDQVLPFQEAMHQLMQRQADALPKTPVTQEKIDRVFRLDKPGCKKSLARKASLASHANELKHKLLDNGMPVDEITKFIKSLGLE